MSAALRISHRPSSTPPSARHAPRVRLLSTGSSEASLVAVELPRHDPQIDRVMTALRDEGCWVVDRREKIDRDAVHLWLEVTEVGGSPLSERRGRDACRAIVHAFSGRATSAERQRARSLGLVGL